MPKTMLGFPICLHLAAIRAGQLGGLSRYSMAMVSTLGTISGTIILWGAFENENYQTFG